MWICGRRPERTWDRVLGILEESRRRGWREEQWVRKRTLIKRTKLHGKFTYGKWLTIPGREKSNLNMYKKSQTWKDKEGSTRKEKKNWGFGRIPSLIWLWKNKNFFFRFGWGTYSVGNLKVSFIRCLACL